VRNVSWTTSSAIPRSRLTRGGGEDRLGVFVVGLASVLGTFDELVYQARVGLGITALVWERAKREAVDTHRTLPLGYYLGLR
jgi:hypothetical protein